MSLLTAAEAAEKRNKKRQEGETVVFTNGCFDLLHSGHLHLFQQARQQGDYLVVGLNSDESVQRLKGKSRPLQPAEERAELIDALEPVDDVVIFSEDTPLQLLEKLCPDVLVKGADYKKSEIVGAELVESEGGRVHRGKLKAGRGTSELIARVLQAHGWTTDDG